MRRKTYMDIQDEVLYTWWGKNMESCEKSRKI